MASKLSPQMIVLPYWLVMIVITAFFLRMACSICQTNMPSWRRSIISVVLVSFLGYLTWDFAAYLIMRGMQDVLIQVPDWYGYNYWFREPIALKWYVISRAGPLRYLPFVFALCAVGVLQVIVLQAEVTFRFGLLIFLLQWGAALVAGYVVGLLFGVGLNAIGWEPEQLPVAQAPDQVQQQPDAKKSAPPGGRRTAARRSGAQAKKAPGAQAKRVSGTQAKKAAEASPSSLPTQAPAGDQAQPEPNSLQALQQQAEGAIEGPREQLRAAGENLKAYANSHIDQLREDLAPLTRHLPEPVQNFLDRGGWWGALGVLGFMALLWLRRILRKLAGAVSRPRRKKKKQRRMKSVTINLKEDLSQLGEGYTEPGPKQVTVQGMPARLRLVIFSLGTRNAGELSEEMADRVLDWIKPGLAEVTAADFPRVRVWPPFFSADGFTKAFAANVPIPELKGERSHWVLVSGQVKMGKAVVNVGLGFYADEANTLRNLNVKGERWASVLGAQKSRRPVMAE
jgi:hypothetical protein